MDTSNIPGADLLIKYIYEDITEEELALLYKYMEDSPVLKEKFEEWSDSNKLSDRFRFQFNIDTEAAWQKFKSEHPVEDKLVTGIQINWLRSIFRINWFRSIFKTGAVIPLVVCIFFCAVCFFIVSIQSHQAEERSDPGLSAPVNTAYQSENGYLDLADRGRFDLDSISQSGIDLSGSSILSQGALFTIENNNVERETPRTIKLVTADKPIKLQLPDGSQVTINKKSSLVVPLPFNSGQRTVGLLGEAYFEVQRNPKVPFIVQLNDNAEVKAYGTTFNVSCSGKDCYTTLLHGEVTVKKNGKTKTLSTGEQVQITVGDQPFKIVQADPQKVIAWTRKTGFDFKNIGFKQMMLELGKWYGYQIYFEGEMPLGTCNIKLNEDADLDFLLKTIEKDDNVQIQKTPDKKLIVISK